MNYLSVCSGIEAATVAWHPLGWKAVAFSEIEKFPSQVLAYHYPDVPNVGDMTKFKEWNLGSDVDVFVGGTPCQSFSVAGLRKGLDDPRGNLMLTYLAIADKYRPRWLVWENVPGVLSSNSGKDFGTFLGGLGELGYGFAYRVLDAQYFGVAQRRRRVFVVGYLGDWRPAAAVLFERHSLSGHPAPSREKRKAVAASVRAGIADVCPTIGCELAKQVNNQMVGNAEAFYIPEQKPLQPIALAENTIGRQPHNGGNGDGFTDGGPMYTLNATGVHGVAQPIPFGVSEKPDVGHCLRSGASKADKHESTTYIAQPIGTDLYNGAITGDIACTMGTPGSSSNASGPTVMHSMAVRRLTPIECERLQGFPDNYTNIKEKCPDGPRYKALGNSMAVPVMAWIGQRINEVEQICKLNK